MNFPFYIARRYLLSKKSTNAINVISGVAVTGVAVATMALVVTLSVFNGFHDLVASLFTALDPQLQIVPTEGKTAPADAPALASVRALPQVDVATECFEDNALATFGDRQAMVVVKGVDDSYAQMSHITGILYGDGTYELHAANLQYGIPGIRLAQTLGTGARWDGFMQLYAPRRSGQIDMANPRESLVSDSLLSPGVVFSVGQSKYDNDHIIVSLSFARRLFDAQGLITSLELRLRDGSDVSEVKKTIERLTADSGFTVRDRYEQQADTFRIMKVEKLIAYIFLTFILIVTCFNIIGSLSMLIAEKRNDVATLRSLGASDSHIARIFLFEGRIISVAGAVIGIAIGLLLCWLQQTFGIVSLGGRSGSFIIDAYPVSVHAMDIVIVFVTVIVTGFIAVWYPVRYFSRRLLAKE